jgi:hypothetical protein
MSRKKVRTGRGQGVSPSFPRSAGERAVGDAERRRHDSARGLMFSRGMLVATRSVAGSAFPRGAGERGEHQRRRHDGEPASALPTAPPYNDRMDTASASAPRRYPGRLYLLLGLGVVVLGILGYVAQLAAQRLFVPWYVPGLATLGVVLVLVSLWQARTVWRVLALLLVLLLAGAEWAFLLSARLPAYTGPVAVGQPFPEFTTTRADGTTLTPRDLIGGQNNVLVFFRGRW